MKLKILVFLLLISQGYSLKAQHEARPERESPYKTSWKVDAPLTAVGMGLSYYGLTLMQGKDGLTEEQISQLRITDVNSFDRFSAGWDSERANTISDIPFYTSFAMPFVWVLNDNIRSHAGQVFGLYVQTMALTGTLFTITNGLTPRTRPMTYSADVDLAEKMRPNSRNAFYAGHTAASASATFFFAKVFHDFNPDSPARPYVWAVAAAVPATVGYLRLRAGKHFLSDNILGYTLGAAAGILVPQLHKRTNKSGLNITPMMGSLMGYRYEGAALAYKF